MAMWHCPHCGTPQAETARCWVCRRSSTTCSTCRHFRVSLAAEVGYCALDRHRRPLTGLEQRACWAQATAEASSSGAGTGTGLEPDRISARRRAPVPYGADDADSVPARGFVPIEEVARAPAPVLPGDFEGSAPRQAPPAFLLDDPIEGWESRTSLFGDPER